MSASESARSGDLRERLLRIAPVRHALQDPWFEALPRPLDDRWSRLGVCDRMAGFAPLHQVHYYPWTSPLRGWLEDVQDPLSPDDETVLVRAALGLAHDYLHSWAYRAISVLRPEHRVGAERVGPDNFDLFLNLHLLTEAVACVGLDYWTLCTLDGPDWRGWAEAFSPLTTHYHDRDAAAFRRRNPQHDPQHPNFLATIVRLYHCDEIEGFDLPDVRDDARLRAWLAAELLASRSQRATTRLWLANLAEAALDDDALGAPTTPPRGDFLDLTLELSHLLWRKVKQEEPLFFPAGPRPDAWRYPNGARPDFRVCNLARLPLHAWPTGGESTDSFWFFAQQLLSRRQAPGEEAMRAFVPRIGHAVRAADARAVSALCDELEPVQADIVDTAPLELILVN